MSKNYLFEFKFDDYTINSYIINYFREKEIDYIHGQLGGVYADVYGENKYYHISTEAVGNGVFEVYYDNEDYILNDNNFTRIYPLKLQAVIYDSPVRKLRLFLSKGSPIIQDVCLPSLEAKKSYLGRQYLTLDGIGIVNHVEVLA